MYMYTYISTGRMCLTLVGAHDGVLANRRIHLSLTALCVPNSLDSGMPVPFFFGVPYRSTALIRNRCSLGTYSRPFPRPHGGPKGGRRFLMSEVPL